MKFKRIEILIGFEDYEAPRDSALLNAIENVIQPVCKSFGGRTKGWRIKDGRWE